MAKRDMGIGKLGQPDTILKTKFRWTFEIRGFCRNQKNVVPEHYVKSISRPNLDIEEIELNFLNGTTWQPAKGKWQEISVNYHDVASIEMIPIFNWLATIYDFTDPVGLRMGTKRDWDATGVITMYDGCGNPLEQWRLSSLWPKSMNFGELDYDSAEPCTIEINLRYSDVKYISLCPRVELSPCCSGCDGTTQGISDSNINSRIFGG